jgi:hypothetical protein
MPILSFLNATKNLWLIGVAVLFGASLMFGSYRVGVKHERNKVNARTMEVNSKIVEARAEDRATGSSIACRSCSLPSF